MTDTKGTNSSEQLQIHSVLYLCTSPLWPSSFSHEPTKQMVKVQALQANPSLSTRNWNTKGTNRNTVTVPWYPFCILVLVLQIGAILLVNKEIALSDSSSSSNINSKPIVRRFKRYDQSTTTQILNNLQNRPDWALTKNSKLQSLEERIRNEFQVHVKACRWYRRNTQGKIRVLPDDDCDRPNQEFFVYNPLDHDRFICGGSTIVPAKGFLRINNVDCNIGMTKSRLFAITPRLVHAKQMPPVEIGIVAYEGRPIPDSMRNSMTPEDFPCDVPCRKMLPSVLVADFAIGGTSWVLRYSMESAIYYPEVQIDKETHHYNFYYATTSFDSEIPLPYFSWDEYNIQAPPVNYDTVIKGASFIATNCDSTNQREDVVTDLMQLLRVDALGKCLHNADPPPGSSIDDTQSMKQKYLFHLAFENSNDVDCKWP
jgi:Glycosyltransferase family 10 (fucosyltransferase) C-term